jgi:hypothetical protein
VSVRGHEAKLADDIERGFEDRWPSAVEMAKSGDRIKQIDAEQEFKITPPQVTDFDRGSQSQTDTTGSAPIPTSSAAEIDIDQSLAIEFSTAAYDRINLLAQLSAIRRRDLRMRPNEFVLIIRKPTQKPKASR